MRNRGFLKQCDINQELKFYLKFALIFTFFGVLGLLLSVSLSVNLSYYTQIVLPLIFIIIAVGFGLRPLRDAYITMSRRKRAIKEGVRVNAVVIDRRKFFNPLKSLSSRILHKVEVKDEDNTYHTFEFETTERFLRPFTRYEIGEEISGFVDFTSRAFFFPRELNQVS
ncbi:MAG: hypothetical protein MRY83_24605 [Flavobacteriales bacterium]|nr:hypothetical protein [Flavobacteriales bacterium]